MPTVRSDPLLRCLTVKTEINKLEHQAFEQLAFERGTTKAGLIRQLILKEIHTPISKERLATGMRA
jgi:hypothetical protein